MGDFQATHPFLGTTSSPCTTSCELKGGHSWDWDVSECNAYPDKVKEEVHTRRLFPSPVLDVERLTLFLQRLESEHWAFPQMIYQSLKLDLDYHLGGTWSELFIPVIKPILALATPFYHHQILFPLGSNGTLASPVQRALGVPHWDGDVLQHTFLLIHLLRDGVEGRFLRSPPPAVSGFQFEGKVEPSWVFASLDAIGRTSFSSISWNCQHFATHLADDVGRHCITSGEANCPPEDVQALLPFGMSPARNFPFQAMVVVGVPTALVVGLLWKVLKALNRRATKGDVADVSKEIKFGNDAGCTLVR